MRDLLHYVRAVKLFRLYVNVCAKIILCLAVNSTVSSRAFLINVRSVFHQNLLYNKKLSIKYYDSFYSWHNFCVRVCKTILSSTYFRFVDYQLCLFTNAAQDLQYFLHTSPSINLLEKHSVLVEEYYNTLHSTLTSLGRAELCPSLQQLYKQIDKLGRFAVLVACTVLPFVMSDPKNPPDVEKVLKERQLVHFSERYKDAIKTLLPLFEQRGWLEFETA